MAIKLNQSQQHSGNKRMCSSTAERRVMLAESIIGNMHSRSYCDTFGNAILYAPSAHVVRAIDGIESEPYTSVPHIETEAPQSPGVARTHSGTIEFIRHPGGTFIKPHYNRCGILTGIDFSDGSRFIRGDRQTPWLVLDENGQAVEGVDITTVSLDARGNVLFATADGEKTVVSVDGTISSRPSS